MTGVEVDGHDPFGDGTADPSPGAISAWELPAYRDLTSDGVVANDVESWAPALLGARGIAQPESQDELPRVVDGDAVIRSLLTSTWPRDELLIGLPDLGHAH